jgi:hypothetical protein
MQQGRGRKELLETGYALLVTFDKARLRNVTNYFTR